MRRLFACAALILLASCAGQFSWQRCDRDGKLSALAEDWKNREVASGSSYTSDEGIIGNATEDDLRYSSALLSAHSSSCKGCHQ